MNPTDTPVSRKSAAAAPDAAAALDGMMAIYGRLTADLPPAVEEAVPGAEIGRCRLCEKLAEGGMGVVWRAEQLSPVQRDVAVKILKLGMDTEEFVRRFRIELEALARLEHPHIARVYDAGITPRGRPFLVMELVRGAEPVTDYCRRSGADLRERLTLFAVICAAVQYAHQRGVIHRDLKPSNLLVSSEDGTARPVVIDFGVARAAGPVSDGGNQTEAGRLLGTPAYMSPEQAAAGETAADTRTDIYALGCVLYELIAGAPPFDHERIRTSSYAELARLLREENPPLPSERLRRGGHPADAARVRGELDWIVMKALAKDPEQRYSTAAGLEEDVRCYLRGDTVTARPSSLAYRLRKFTARHKPAAAAVLVAVVSFMVTTGVSLWRARREADERRNAEAILRFFDEDLVGAARHAADASGTADPLDAAARRIAAEFGDRPVLAARLRTTLGRAYLNMGDPARASRELPGAYKTLTDALGPRHPETLRAAAGMAGLSLSSGRADESVKRWRDVVAALETAGDSSEWREASLGLAQALSGTGANADAARQFESVLKNARGTGSDFEFVSRVELAFAAMLERSGDSERADALTHEALKLREHALGSIHPETLAAVSALARVREQRGDSAAALELLRRSFDGLRTALGSAHPKTAAAQKAFAESCERLGDEATALSLSISAALALSSSGRDAEALESFITAARLSQRFGVAEYADRFRVTAWNLSRRLGLPADGPHLPRSMAVQFPGNGHWYQRFEVPMSWTDADTACRALGGHLATATSLAENTLLYQRMATECACWLGASRDSEGRWQWVTGEPFLWTHWADGEPSNTDGQEKFLNFGSSTLTHFRKGQFWNDHQESGEHAGWLLTYPICEWEPPATPPAAPPPAARADALPRTSTRIFAATGHSYARINVPMSWTDAASVCEALGGHLACPAGAEENDFLLAQFASDRLCWLGGTDREKEGEWRWITGESFGFAPWAEGEPNNSGGIEHFTQFGSASYSSIRTFGREWNDAADDGTWQMRFLTYPICEWDQAPRGHPPATN